MLPLNSLTHVFLKKILIYLFIYLFIYLLAMQALHCRVGYSLGSVHGLLIEAVSLVVEHGL